MKTIEMGSGVVLEVIDEAILFDGNSLSDFARRFPNDQVLPILVYYGSVCKYFNMLRVRTPFEFADRNHNGYHHDIYDPKANEQMQLLARVTCPDFIQIAFSPKDWERVKGQIPLAKHPDVLVSVWGPHSLEEAHLAIASYTILGRSTGYRRALIVGQDCKKQLQEWGIAENKLLQDIFTA